MTSLGGARGPMRGIARLDCESMLLARGCSALTQAAGPGHDCGCSAYTGHTVMRASDFRKIALALPEAVEGAHGQHPDFRVGRTIFASLDYPDVGWAMVKLTPAQQTRFVVREQPTFSPVAGAWGRRGYTNIELRNAKASAVREALMLAWRNCAPKRLGDRA